MSLPNFINFEPFNRLRRKMHVEKLGNFQLAKKVTRAVVEDPTLLVKEPVRAARKVRAKALESATELKQEGRRRAKAAGAAVKAKASDGAAQIKSEGERRVRAVGAAAKAVARKVKPSKAGSKSETQAKPAVTKGEGKPAAKSPPPARSAKAKAAKIDTKSAASTTGTRAKGARGAKTTAVRTNASGKSKAGQGRA